MTAACYSESAHGLDFEQFLAAEYADEAGSQAEAPDGALEVIAIEPLGTADEAGIPSAAPPQNRRALEEIVVTAQRREENLQQVPISVSAYSEAMIADRNIASIADVALTTPGFVASQSFGQIAPTIRGIGADRFTVSSEPGVALYIDDVYLGRPYLPQATLSQIERIEILKGPQGTLYGRNTSGGAVKIVTRRPTEELEFSGSLQYGSYDHFAGKASLSGPLTDDIRARLSVFKEQRDGYTYNAARDETVDAHEAESARFSADIDLGESLTWSINADVNRQYDTGPTAYAVVPVTFSVLDDRLLTPALAPFDSLLNPLLSLLDPADPVVDVIADALTARIGGRNSTQPRTVNQDFLSFTDIESQTVSTSLALQLGEIDLKLIGGYADSTRDFPNDSDLTDLRAITLTTGNTTGEQVSAELQATSSFEMPFGGELRWLAGGYYYRERASEIYDFEVLSITDALGIDDPALQLLLDSLGPLLPQQPATILQNGGVGQIFYRTRQLTASQAVFVDLQWDPTHWLIVHLGGRYTNDEKTLLERTARNVDPRIGCEQESGSKNFEATTIRAGLDFLVSDEAMLYGSFAQGFKAGGFSGISCGTGPYAPEYVDAWEVGLKSQWLDSTLQFNAALFSYTFTDIQVEKVVGFATEVENAAEANIRGGELSLQYVPFDFLSIDAALGYLDATYGEFFDDDPYTIADERELDLSGNRLNKAPEWSGSIGLTLSHLFSSGSEASLRGEWSYTGSMFYDQFNHDFARAPSYEVWNAYLTYDVPQHGLTLRGFGKNLTDELYIAGQFTASALVGSPYAYYSMPRTVGVEIEYRFGALR
jgi:iron complex outermembrane recepter protein